MFAKLLTMSILLVGPEGAAIFGLLVFKEKKIEGRGRQLALAVVTVAIATVASLVIALFGSIALKYMGIALGAVDILGGIVSVKTGLEPLKIDLLKPFRREDDKEKKQAWIVARRSVWLITPTAGGGLLAQSAQVEGITEVEEANKEEKNENGSAPEPHGWLRRLVNDLPKVFVPIVFPTSVGPAYIAWLVNPTSSGKPLHPSVVLLVTATLVTMLVTLSAMTVAVLIGKKMPDWLENFLARVGGTFFVLFGIGTFFGGLNMLT